MDLIYIRRITISFPQLQLKPFDIPKFRGYLARRYSQYILIHNHLKDGALRYAYPTIKFKTRKELESELWENDSTIAENRLRRLVSGSGLLRNSKVNKNTRRIGARAGRKRKEKESVRLVIQNDDPINELLCPFKE